MHISFTPEEIFHIGNFAITNTLLTSWLVVIMMIALAFFLSKALRQSTRASVLLELVVEKISGFLEPFAGSKENLRKFFPFVVTIFFYVLLSNWMGTLPGVETIGFHEVHEVDGHSEEVWVPLLRTVNSDLNMTLALALLTVIMSHIIGVRTIGAGHHAGKFLVNPLKSPIGFFVGILEIIGEFARVISLTFRLFGNIFAGSVLILVISSLIPFIAPIPFLGMELFVGLIQALIFATLATMFFGASVAHHAEAH